MKKTLLLVIVLFFIFLFISIYCSTYSIEILSSGAKVKKASTLMFYGVSQFPVFNVVEFDTDNYYSSLLGNRLTIPSDFRTSQIYIVSGQFYLYTNGKLGVENRISILKNGVYVVSENEFIPAGTATYNYMNTTTIDMSSPGDFYNLVAMSKGGSGNVWVLDAKLSLTLVK